ncbi:MAG: hypothetical protein D6797_05095 [Bdellovibrio sp.]|nr:MAG: hypothetical protein D6797_05095 [Bdellovibrio sp.]
MKKVLFTILFLFTFSFSGERSWSRSKTIGEILKKIEKTSVKKQKSVLPKVKYQRVKQKKINLKAIKPPSTRKLYGEESGDEAELEKTLDMEIRQLYKLVKRYKRSRKRGELWLRLAELYVERARLIEFRLQNEYDKKLALYHVGKLKRKPRLNLKPAQEFNLKAISLYESYLKIFSKSKKIDQALFFLGYNYFQMNQVKKGERYYQQLIEKFPKSPYVTEAHFALGEFYFENEKWNLAKNNYKKVILNRKSRLYPLALYKYAWCQYKVGNTSEALKSLERVVVEGQKSKGSSSRQNIHLVSEAINDLIMFYADARSYKSARSYFKRFMNARQLNKTIEKLAYLYMSRDDREAARYLFKDLISQDPTSEKAFDYQYQIVNMYVSVGDSKEFKRELLYWIDRFSPDSIWSKVNRKNKDLLKKSYKIMELTLRNYVLQKHQTAQNSRAPHAQKLAQAAYELYFNTFTQSPKIDEMHFFYAELLFDMKKYRKAAYHYLWVNKKTPQSSYAKQALINALLALEKELPSPYEIKKVVGNSKEPIEFDRSVLDFLKVAKEYLKKFPKEKNSIAVQYKVAVMNYYYNHFDEALKGFESVIKKAPKSKYASYSANLMLDVYNIRKDFVGLEKAAKMILSIPAIASSSVGMQIQSIQQKTAFAIAHQ